MTLGWIFETEMKKSEDDCVSESDIIWLKLYGKNQKTIRIEENLDKFIDGKSI